MAGNESHSSREASSWPPLAHLYALATLDPMIEVAQALGHDFARRPWRYKTVPGQITPILESFRTRIGADPDWPSSAQRKEMFVVLCDSEFSGATIALRTAAVAFANSAHSASPTRGAFEDAAETARAYFLTLDGEALNIASSRLGGLFANAVALLRVPDLTRAFGLAPAPSANWPVAKTVDGDAAQLLEAISEALGISRSQPFITAHRFMVLQRVAFQGGQTVAKLLAGDAANSFNDALDAAYRWEMSLQELLFGVDIARAWADPTYRDSLSETEKSALPPHPSGDVTMEGIPLGHRMASRSDLGFSTMTLLAICCSTGDLPCTLGDTSSCTKSAICEPPPPPPKTLGICPG